LNIYSKPIVYVNELESDAPRIQQAIARGWTVVHASSPAFAEEIWKGLPRHGIYYFAGDINELGAHWMSFDVRLVVVVSNIQIEDLLRKVMINRGFASANSNGAGSKQSKSILCKQAKFWLGMPYMVES
jgi:hypothetical protein